MSESWLRDYIQLALRIDKVFHVVDYMPFVDYYYGPPKWKAELENEPAQEPLALIRASTALLEALSTQDFDAHRTTYLSRQVIAMEMVCRKLHGEIFTFAEELQRIFDIQFVWTPETQLEEGLALYDEALPGKGTLADRLHAWGNAAFLFRDKRPDDEVEAYLKKFLRRANIAFWQQPFHDFFPSIEYYGKRLVQPHLQGANRQAMFRRLLTEQVYPSELVV